MLGPMGKRRDKESKQQAPLSTAEIGALNRAFYGTDPAEHFSRRFHLLLAQASQSDRELRAEAKEYKFGKISMAIPSTTEGDVDEDAHKRFVLIEAELFIHHAAETLMRLYFAHSGSPPAPWAEMAKLRGPGELTRRLKAFRKERQKERVLNQVRLVFFGYERFPEDWSNERVTESEAALVRVADYLDYFSELLLERGQTYNAVKHGSAVEAGESALAVGEIKELSASGPSISYLDRRRNDENKSFWAVKTRWIPLEFDISLSYVGTQLLNALWTVARVRYVKWPIPDNGQRLSIPKISLGDVRKAAAMPAIQIDEVVFPAEMHCPPGAGADAKIAGLKEETKEDTDG
jgi:hypothetical protein